jgi:hypothetical protein
MAKRSAAAFLVDVEELRAFSVMGLGGSVDAMAATLTAAGVTLRGGAAHDCLLHVPSAAAAGQSRSAPCLELVHVQRRAPQLTYSCTYCMLCWKFAVGGDCPWFASSVVKIN